MTIGGDRANLEAFLKEIMESDKEILITSFAWSKYRVQKTKQGVIVTDKNKNSLIVDHMLVVLSEHHLSANIVLGTRDVHRLVTVGRDDSGLCKLVGHVCSDDIHSV